MLYIAADHAGVKLKEYLKKNLMKKKISFKDLSTDSSKSDDYPVYAKRVGKKVAKEKEAKGVLICGTGTGMVIAANKIKGVRATVGYDAYSAKMSRYDNDSNVLCLRGRKINLKKEAGILNTWLDTSFSKKSRHKKRIKKIENA